MAYLIFSGFLASCRNSGLPSLYWWVVAQLVSCLVSMYELGMEGHDCNISIQEVRAGGLESQGGAQLIGGQSILYETFSGKEKTKLILL